MRIVLVLLLALPSWAWASLPLQPLIDATPAGGTLKLAPGEYAGPVVLSRPLMLEGGGKSLLRGDGNGTVLVVRTDGAIVRGLGIAASGESSDRMDAGILVEGDRNRIEDNVLTDVFFGIHLRAGRGNRILNNRVTGKDRPKGLRGDGARLWNSRENLIQGNHFRRVRDMTVANSPDNSFVGNTLEDARQGMELVFSPRARLEDNRIAHADAGIVVLYSPDAVLRGNRIAHVLDGGGSAIAFKESGAGLVEGNEAIHCAVGLTANTPQGGEAVLTIRGNRFAHNIIGMKFYGEAGGHRILGNRFEHNLSQVVVSAVGTGSANQWRGNYWSDYQGFDRNGDGVGDTPHELYLYTDRIWLENPMASFFRNAPGLELLDFLERLAPFAAPALILRDELPRMK